MKGAILTSPTNPVGGVNDGPNIAVLKQSGGAAQSKKAPAAALKSHWQGPIEVAEGWHKYDLLFSAMSDTSGPQMPR
jgi:hypothetical protein